MNDFLVTIGLIILAIGIAMGITTWRIRNLQYPPELRWPKKGAKRRSRRSDKKRDDDHENAS